MALTTLVVDDIQDSRVALTERLRALGHVVVEVANGRSALDILDRSAPDLVFLDLLMPDMDGFEVMRRLRDRVTHRWVPVVVMSSLQGEEQFVQALENGADDCLHRPIHDAMLRAKLRHYERVLTLQRSHAALAQRQRDTLDNILDPVMTLDDAGRVESLNRTALGLADTAGRALGPGAQCESIFGVSVKALLDRADVALHRRGGASFDAEIGRSTWHEGDRTYHTLILRDLTERRQIERMKDEFLATVSHELRTPLTSIIGAVGLLAGGAAGVLPPKALPLADVARRNGERLGRLIDDILDLTKLEGDRLVFHRRPQALAPLVREAITANLGYAARANVSLRSEPPVNSNVERAQTQVDADRFLQVMSNLLSNAIKHSPSGQTVRVSVDCDAARVHVTVRDRGPGIDPQFRARMFEKFSQADSTDRRAQGGTGLGLYITRMLVERMGGRITVDEVAGDGASFTVSFPVVQSAVPSAPLVLYIDHDIGARERVTRWLSPSYRVEGVSSVAQGVARAGEARLFIGNPQSQGSADSFCAELSRIATGRPLLLYGDSIDPAFSAIVGVPWLSPARSGRDELLEWVRGALAAIEDRTVEIGA